MKLPGFSRRRTSAADGAATGGRQPRQGNSGPSVQMLTIRVAMTAAAIVGVAYLAIAIVVAAVVSNNLTSEVDHHLAQALNSVADVAPAAPDGGQPGPGFDPARLDPRGPSLLLWKVGPTGSPQPQGINPLTLPAQYAGVTSSTTVSIDGASYRIAGQTTAQGTFIFGQSLDGVSSTEGTLVAAELGIGCTLLICVFLGALAIGRRVATPIEHERQRQLEFTADASHELRTPLSVIEAQTSLALARARDPSWDTRAFGRIDTELRRTRRLVDDMLWLARFDSTGGRPDSEPVDVGVLAAQTADRFAAVAESRGQKLEVATDGVDEIVMAPPDWLDRLVGVLLDNALKYSPDGGSVVVFVSGEGRHVRLTVDDSGPGIPEAERARVFDRFHRATTSSGGAGLGLAIADAIARATGGHWHIATSPAGGASVSVSWPRHSISADSGGR
jgi:signal transduction histidine kinase